MTPLEYLVPPGALDDAGTHAHIDLTGSEAHHAVRVQRLAVGEWVDVVDGAGVRVRGVVEAVSGAEPRSTPRRVLPPPRSDPLPRGDTGEELREDSTRPSPSSSGRSLTGEELREDSTRPSPSRISRSPRGRPPRGVPGTGPRGGDPVLRLRVAEVSREVNDAAGIVLIQALAKGGRDEMAVEAATGLGVARIVPWAAARSVVRWPGPKAQRGRERWQAIARAETTVARRSWVPAVDPLMTTAQIVAAIHTGTRAGAAVGSLAAGAAADAAVGIGAGAGAGALGVGVDVAVGAGVGAVETLEGAAVLVLHEDATVPFASAVRTAAAGLPDRPLVLMVGPEGGIAPEEVQALVKVGATPVVLGSAVLRTSAAGPAALAALTVLRAT